jgi:thiamine-phosphate pyrophosphorylase
MKIDCSFKIDYSLYLCTDRKLMNAPTLALAVQKAIEGGCTVIQHREKNCSSLTFYEEAVKLKAVTDKYNVPLIINDRLDIAQAVDAAGVHIGQEDIPADAARKILGENKLIGVSAGSVAEAVAAERSGADYLGVGAMYGTATKPDANIVTLDELKKIRAAVKIPIVVIGGINENTAANFKNMGIDGLAVVSAVIGAENITEAAQRLLKIWRA